jgi:hypothetical protein
VPEIRDVAVGVVTACATAEALDALVVPGRATPCRIADDEVFFVCDPDLAGEVTRELQTRLTVVDADAIVLDTTDGWTAVRIGGDDRVRAFASRSRLRVPDRGFVQGDVAHVPAKVVADEGGILVLAPSVFEHHLRSRLARAAEETP